MKIEQISGAKTGHFMKNPERIFPNLGAIIASVYCFKTFIKAGAFISTQSNLDFILHTGTHSLPDEGI